MKSWKHAVGVPVMVAMVVMLFTYGLSVDDNKKALAAILVGTLDFVGVIFGIWTWPE